MIMSSPDQVSLDVVVVVVYVHWMTASSQLQTQQQSQLLRLEDGCALLCSYGRRVGGLLAESIIIIIIILGVFIKSLPGSYLSTLNLNCDAMQ